MAIRAITVRHKGQMTLPADVRKELGLRDGDVLYLERRGNDYVLVRPDDVVDPTAGILSEYAYTRNPDAAKERDWVAKHIAETADDYE